MGRCHEFGVEVEHGCTQPMRARHDHCACPRCGAVCEGRFSGCSAVWLTAPPRTEASGAPSSVAGAPVAASSVAVEEMDLLDDAHDAGIYAPVAGPAGVGVRGWFARALAVTGLTDAFGGRRRRDAVVLVGVLAVVVGGLLLLPLIGRGTTARSAADTRATTSVVPTTAEAPSSTVSPPPDTPPPPDTVAPAAASAPAQADAGSPATGTVPRQSTGPKSSRPTRRPASPTSPSPTTAPPTTPTTGSPPTWAPPGVTLPTLPLCPVVPTSCPNPG